MKRKKITDKMRLDWVQKNCWIWNNESFKGDWIIVRKQETLRNKIDQEMGKKEAGGSNG